MFFCDSVGFLCVRFVLCFVFCVLCCDFVSWLCALWWFLLVLFLCAFWGFVSFLCVFVLLLISVCFVVFLSEFSVFFVFLLVLCVLVLCFCCAAFLFLCFSFSISHIQFHSVIPKFSIYTFIRLSSPVYIFWRLYTFRQLQ